MKNSRIPSNVLDLYFFSQNSVLLLFNSRFGVKLFENIFRSVNIALVNELKVVYEAMGIDVHEVIDAAATKPFGFMAFRPGPGLGGHCIPIDPFYLTWKAREFEVITKFSNVVIVKNFGFAMKRTSQRL